MEKKEENLIEKVNKLSLPATILIASIVLGGFYYFSQLSKQNSIEKQQQVELQAKKDQADADAFQKSLEASQKALCVSQAEQQAQDQYKLNCTYNCHTGYFYIADKDNYYNTCLQSKGLK